jgi:ABC-type multidrug transport system fused ATPase/permease subunit
MERNLHDALGVARNIFANPKLLPGGGATEMELSHRLNEIAKNITGLAQKPYRAVAFALEAIPRTLAQNCGGDVVRLLTELRAKHSKEQGLHFGIDGNKGVIADMQEINVWEPLLVKSQVIKTAIESSCMLLRIDDVVSGTKKIPDADFKGEIVFEDVEFRYPTKLDMPLLEHFSLRVAAGTRVAFSGSSGCGKSSAVGLVQRLYDPLSGRILIDGVDLKELDIEWFRSHVGVVAQEPTLFSGTLKDNVKFGKPSATDEEVKKAYRQMAIKFHPDKVAQMGEEFQKGAKEKFQQIQDSYEAIKKQRGFK